MTEYKCGVTVFGKAISRYVASNSVKVLRDSDAVPGNY
jgi:hypothetical protein